MKYCRYYCGVACVDGTCPTANREEYEERDIPVPRNCRECHMYRGCEDCCFPGTEYCTKDKQFELKAQTIMEETLNRYRNSIPRKAAEEMVSKIIREAFEHYKED